MNERGLDWDNHVCLPLRDVEGAHALGPQVSLVEFYREIGVRCSLAGYRTAREIIDSNDHPRSIPDDLVLANAATDGVIGINGVDLGLDEPGRGHPRHPGRQPAARCRNGVEAAAAGDRNGLLAGFVWAECAPRHRRGCES